MSAHEAFEKIGVAIKNSATEKNHRAWQAAVKEVGLIEGGKLEGTNEYSMTYHGSFDEFEVRVVHESHDTSKTMKPGPDVEQLRVDLMKDGKVIDTESAAFFERN